jgi:hypothetical protein
MLRVFLLATLLLLAARSSFAQSTAPAVAPADSDLARAAELMVQPEAKYVDLGDNVTQTAYVLEKARCTFGSWAAGCGVTDKLMLITSPWLLTQYNMWNFWARLQVEKHESHESAVQLAYFKTYDTGRNYPVESNPGSPMAGYYCSNTLSCFNGYEMEAAWLYWLSSERITRDYVFHWNFQVAYYWDDTKPFSLRRPQAWKTPWQVNLMSLHEVHMLGPYYLRGEVGFLGIDGKFPALHSGVALQYRKNSWSCQLGATASGYLNAWFTTGRFDYQAQALSNSRDGLHQNFSDGQLIDDFSIHPEIFLQYTFDI